MKRLSLVVLVAMLGVNGAQAATLEECLASVQAIKREVTKIAMFQLPAMVSEDQQGTGYQMQYGVMMGTTTSNRASIISQLENACRDAIDTAALVKEKEISP